MPNQSAYNMEGIERALRISYHDVHERERGQGKDWSSSPTRRAPKGYGKRGYAHAVDNPEDDHDYPDDLNGEGTDEDYDEAEHANAVEGKPDRRRAVGLCGLRRRGGV